jgi:hypothetical protein
VVEVVVVGTTPVEELVVVVGVTEVLVLVVVVGVTVGHWAWTVGFFALKSLSAEFLIWLVTPKSTE